MKLSPNMRTFLRRLRFCAGVMNLCAIVALFAIPPDTVEPASTPWAWWPWLLKCQFAPAVLALDTAIIAAILVASILLGRIYCEAVCPLGVAQDILRKVAHPVKRLQVRRVCSRLPVTQNQWKVRFCILLASVTAVAAGTGLWAIDPYAIFCRAMTFIRIPSTSLAYTLLAAVPFALVAVLAFVGKGRVWCNWICPVGTFFAAFMRFSCVDSVPDATCGACRACFPKKMEKRQ